jgi:hypothetical protein
VIPGLEPAATRSRRHNKETLTWDFGYRLSQTHWDCCIPPTGQRDLSTNHILDAVLRRMIQGYTISCYLQVHRAGAGEHRTPEQQRDDPHRTNASAIASPPRPIRILVKPQRRAAYTQANGQPSQRVRTTNGMAAMISPLTDLVDQPWWSHAPRHTADSHLPIFPFKPFPPGVVKPAPRRRKGLHSSCGRPWTAKPAPVLITSINSINCGASNHVTRWTTPSTPLNLRERL